MTVSFEEHLSFSLERIHIKVDQNRATMRFFNNFSFVLVLSDFYASSNHGIWKTLQVLEGKKFSFKLWLLVSIKYIKSVRNYDNSLITPQLVVTIYYINCTILVFMMDYDRKHWTEKKLVYISFIVSRQVRT